MSRHTAEAEYVGVQNKLDTQSEAKPTEEQFDVFSKERTFDRENRINSQISETASLIPEFKMDPKTRESAMSVINSAFGEGGLDGRRGKDPKLAPAEQLKELKDILEPRQNKLLRMLCDNTGFMCSTEVNLPRSLNTVIKEDKMAQYQEVAKQATGKADIDAMFNIYGEATSARRGIPTAEGDPAGDGYQWGKQETMKKFPEQFNGENALTSEAKKYWMETGLAHEAGRYTDGLVKYLGRANMNEAERALADLGNSADHFKKDAQGNLVSPIRLTDEARDGLLKALGDPKDEASLDSILKQTVHSQLLKSSLLPENAPPEKALAAVGAIYGLDEQESIDYEIMRQSRIFGQPNVNAKEALDLIVSSNADQIKKALGQVDFSKK